MDKNSAVALTVGLGALGTVLAYYGYNQLNILEDDDDNTDDSPKMESSVASADELRRIAEQRKEERWKEYEQNKTIEANVKLAIEEIKQVKTVGEGGGEGDGGGAESGSDRKPPMSDKEKWRAYWQKEYHNPTPSSSEVYDN